MDELLEATEPGTLLHLELLGGGAVEGEYLSHDESVVTIRLAGQPTAYARNSLRDLAFVVRNEAARAS